MSTVTLQTDLRIRGQIQRSVGISSSIVSKQCQIGGSGILNRQAHRDNSFKPLAAFRTHIVHNNREESRHILIGGKTFIQIGLVGSRPMHIEIEFCIRGITVHMIQHIFCSSF